MKCLFAFQYLPIVFIDHSVFLSFVLCSFLRKITQRQMKKHYKNWDPPNQAESWASMATKQKHDPEFNDKILYLLIPLLSNSLCARKAASLIRNVSIALFNLLNAKLILNL